LVERPEYPKLVAIAGTLEEAQALLPALRQADPDSEIVDSGSRGVYARVTNKEGEDAARRAGEDRSFPLA
jgi:hypothetical protein